MKVLILCMALVAVSLAMPVAEEQKPQSNSLPVAAPEVKSDGIKPEIIEAKSDVKPEEKEKPEEVKPEIKSDSVEKKPEEQKPENEVASKPVEPELKSAIIPESNPEIKPEVVAEENKADSAAIVPEVKSEVSNESEPKQEVKINEPEVQPVEEQKKEEVQAKVEEEKDVPAAKSAINDEIIDVVSAVKVPASVADDVVDPIAINPISEPQSVITGKSAKPEEKKEEAPASESEKKPEEKKSDEPAKENPKEASVAPASVPEVPVVKSGESDAASESDSQRVIRDTVVEKSASGDSSDVKPSEEAKKVEPEPVELPKDVEAKSAVSELEKQAAEEKQPELKVNDINKDGKADEVSKVEIAKETVAEAKSEEPKKEEEPKPNSQALSGANKSSEESGESGEKKEDNVDNSSEESGEKEEKGKSPKS